MSMLYTGTTIAVLSVAGNVADNQAIAQTASANAMATGKMLDQQYGVQQNTLEDLGNQVNSKAGLELTNLMFQALGAKGTTATANVERNITGKTAGRIQENVAMKEALQADSIQQQAEMSMLDINNQLREAKYNYESGQMQNKISFNNMMSNTTSDIGIVANAGTAFISAGGMKGIK